MKASRHRHQAGCRHVAILGSTGSIGVSALDVAAHLKDRVEITGLAAGRNAKLLMAQIRRFRPAVAGISDPEQGAWLRGQLKKLGKRAPVLHIGPAALEAVAVHPASNMLLTSVVGAAGLVPTLKAIEKGKDIALANKETLVAGGELVTAAVRKHGVSVLPVDSEHNAIFQCLSGIGGEHELKRLILTASGGPFRGASASKLRGVKPAQALKHPTWTMGAKITIDSATLMNKGLEVIEAHWLFGIGYDKISVVVHPQSVIHSMVEAIDGSVLAQLGPTDMRLPIQHAFTFPERVAVRVPHLDFHALNALTFEAPDTKRFPCLALAYEAGRAGGAAPAALNAGNEVAVDAFLRGKLDFLGIPRTLGALMRRFKRRPRAKLTLSAILDADQWARREAEAIIHG